MSQLTDSQIAIRDMTREFVRKEVTPFAAQWDRTATVPLETVRKIGALGLFGVCVAAQWGGAGADFTSYVLATEELAYGDAGICNLINATNSFCFKVRDFGTPEQKERFLRPVASGSEIACMLLTEPQAGSDAANLRTRAVRRGDRYVISGAKSLITGGRSADVAVAIAVTDPGAGKRGISAFLLRTSAPGYRVVRVEHKLGHRANDTCQIALEDLEVGTDDMLGPPGAGLKGRAFGARQRAHRGRRAVGRRRGRRLRRRAELRPRARDLRQEADRASGGRLQAGRDGDRD
jgi:butyryl-CoA dehydrogenase